VFCGRLAEFTEVYAPVLYPAQKLSVGPHGSSVVERAGRDQSHWRTAELSVLCRQRGGFALRIPG